MSNDEIQHAEVTVRVALPVNRDTNDERRMDLIANAVHDALDPGMAENRGVIETDLTIIESPCEAAERRLEEAESRALAEAERRAERAFEEGRW